MSKNLNQLPSGLKYWVYNLLQTLISFSPFCVHIDALIKCLTTHTIQQISFASKYKHMVQLVLNKKEVIEREIGLYCSEERRMYLLLPRLL